MTSIGGIQAGGGVMVYRASKAAVIQFTKAAAIELAHHDIRVNAIAPGNIPTPILGKAAAGMDAEQLQRFEARIRETMRDDRPLKREGTPDDIAEAALYFATDRSRYVTGTVLPVDGDGGGQTDPIRQGRRMILTPRPAAPRRSRSCPPRPAARRGAHRRSARGDSG